MDKRPLILISNDDGVHAQGLREVTRLMSLLGDVVVVAPDSPRSGASCSITSSVPVQVSLLREEPGISVFSCSGTPVDCIKIACEKIVPVEPDLIVSGINHGDNASINFHYSGTVGCVFEACLKGIPAIAYSLRTRKSECDFSPYFETISKAASLVLEKGLPKGVCLNVNFPEVPELKGVRVCRMAHGSWKTEWNDTEEKGKYTLAGNFINLEPEAEDTDYWALDHGMAAICPLWIDATHYPTIETLSSLQV